MNDIKKIKAYDAILGRVMMMGVKQEAGGAYDMCPGCHKNLVAAPHPCPYQREINNNNEEYCVCCPECEQRCSDDI